ncbi:1-phosphofructokinase, partial [Vibrio cholerae]
QLGVQDAFIRIAGATRINVKLVEQSGAVSDINFPGIQVTEADIEAFEATLQRLAQDHDYFVLAGSLPQGISPQRCAGWIAQLRSMNKKVLFDSSRDALLAGLDAK